MDGRANDTYARHCYPERKIYVGYFHLDTDTRVKYGTMGYAYGTYEGGWARDEWFDEGIYTTLSGDTYAGIWNGYKWAVNVVLTDAYGKKTVIKNQKIN